MTSSEFLRTSFACVLKIVPIYFRDSYFSKVTDKLPGTVTISQDNSRPLKAIHILVLTNLFRTSLWQLQQSNCFKCKAQNQVLERGSKQKTKCVISQRNSRETRLRLWKGAEYLRKPDLLGLNSSSYGMLHIQWTNISFPLLFDNSPLTSVIPEYLLAPFLDSFWRVVSLT